MGINGFMKNITHDVPEIKKRIYDALYIDCNYLLHYFIYNCKISIGKPYSFFIICLSTNTQAFL